MADFKGQKGGSPMSKTWGFFFGGSGHGPESLCQTSAYYKFFPGFNVFCRISTGLFRNHQAEIIIIKRLIQKCNDVTRVWVEPRSFNHVILKNDALTHSATLPTSHSF